MVDATELNSTFYALRLLSHGLDISQIEPTGGEEYPATEFTKEEQEQALKIIHHIEFSESLSVRQLPPEKTAFYRTSLADRIEELANGDLVNAGYNLQLPTVPFFQGALVSPATATPAELALQLELELLTHGLSEINPQLRTLLELWLAGFTTGEIARAMNLTRGAVSRTLAVLRQASRKTRPEASQSKLERAISLNRS